MNKKTLGIVLCNYNDSRFLVNWFKKSASVVSLADDFVVVDDQSTDNSLEVLKIIKNQNKKIRIVINDGEKGAFNAFRKGYEALDTEYIASMAADDEPLPGYMLYMKPAIKKYPFVDLFSCNLKIKREGEYYDRILTPFDSYLSPEYIGKIFRNGYARQIIMAGIAIRKSTIMKCVNAGGDKMKANLDMMFNLYAMFTTGLFNIGRALYLYRSYPSGFGSSRDIKSIQEANDFQKEFFKKNVCDKAYKDILASGVLDQKFTWRTQASLWAMKKLPYFIRKKAYDWFYGYDWRIEKL